MLQRLHFAWLSSCSQSGLLHAVPKPAWLQHLGHKFQEVLQVNAKSMQGVPDSIPFTADGYGGSTPVLDVRPEHVSLTFPRILCDLISEVDYLK